MATVKTYAGTRTGKKFITLTMGPKEAGSVLAKLKTSPSNKNTNNVASALAAVPFIASYRVQDAQPARTIPAVEAGLVAA